MGDLEFSGTAVSLWAAEDEVGFLADTAGPWPAMVNEEGAQVVVGADSGVGLEWLLWNEGGSLVVRGELWVRQKPFVVCRGRRKGSGEAGIAQPRIM